MIILIDNYDSFVHNLARYFRLQGKETFVIRNDSDDMENNIGDSTEAIILSPGPKTPQNTGKSFDIIKKYGAVIPMLGVCLGHQVLGEAYGGITEKSPKPIHGETSLIHHNEQEFFSEIPTPFSAARYHSLITSFPENSDIEITAHTDDIIMAFQHKEHPSYGIQFHPESCLTEYGPRLIQNFLVIAKEWNASNRKTLLERAA